MIRVTLRSLWEHKRRLVSTVLAIVLGVAFMSGTFIFADTINSVFDDLFADGLDDVDTQVQGTELFESFGDDARRDLDQGLVATIANVEGVRRAEGFIRTVSDGSTNRVLTRDGDLLGPTRGPPTLIEAWMDDDAIRPYVIAEGAPPTEPSHLTMNVAAAEEGGFDVGDEVRMLTQFGEVTYTLVGTMTYGTAESAAGAISTNFVLSEAQRLAGLEGQVNTILVDAVDGIDEETITARIAEILPEGAEAITGTEAAEQIASGVQEGFAFFSQLLTIFGAIALLVGTFIIANTFSILIAQRTRELALLRAIGASRRQVLVSVLVEAAVIGLVAAVTGLVAGFGLATGVSALLEATGNDLPNNGLVVSSRTTITALVIGLTVTIGAAILPAITATRVPPLAAMRDVSASHHRLSRLRIGVGVLVLLLAVRNLAQAFTTDGDTDALPGIGLGAVFLIIGAVAVGPLLAEPSVRLLGSALPRFRGITGSLARENAARSPKRTAATASALLIAVALIGFLTIFGASAQASLAAQVEEGFTGDLMIRSGGAGFGGPGGFPATVADAVEASPLVDQVARAGFLPGQIRYPDGHEQGRFIAALQAEQAGGLFNAEMAVGNLVDMVPGTAIMNVNLAEENEVGVGDTITITSIDARTIDVEIVALADSGALLGPSGVSINYADYATVVNEPTLAQVIIGLADGVDVATGRADVEARIAEVPGLDVLDADDFADTLADQVTGFLTLVNGLLLLSVIIAMIGIANTLSLSIHERTRELGLLRAVGMTRSQLRSAVRWEAVLIALLGTFVGLAVGLVVSWAIIQALSGLGLGTFVVPPLNLLFVVGITGGLGVLASIRPARRAAKLNILTAIASE